MLILVIKLTFKIWSSRFSRTVWRKTEVFFKREGVRRYVTTDSTCSELAQDTGDELGDTNDCVLLAALWWPLSQVWRRQGVRAFCRWSQRHRPGRTVHGTPPACSSLWYNVSLTWNTSVDRLYCWHKECKYTWSILYCYTWHIHSCDYMLESNVFNTTSCTLQSQNLPLFWCFE